MSQRPTYFTKIILAMLATAALVTSAFGQTQMQSFSDSIGQSITNWDDSLTFSQFDPSLGTLECIQIALEGTVDGQASAESRDAAPTTITLDLQALITLSYPASTGGSIATVLPVVSSSFNVTASDGTIDFAGGSGATTGQVMNTNSTMATLSSASDLALFTGTGNITLPVDAQGTSSGSGAGNLITEFATNASSMVTVTYKYEPVPEPAAGFTLLSGLLGTLFFRRRRS